MSPCHLPESVLVPSHLSGVGGSRGQASRLALQCPGHVGEDRRPLKLGQQGPGGAHLRDPPGARAPRLTADRRGWAQTPAANPGLASPHRWAASVPSPCPWGSAQVKARRCTRPGRRGRVHWVPGQEQSTQRWRVRGSGAVLSGDGRGCVQRGACHPSRSESPRVGQDPCGGKAPTCGGTPRGQAALPGDNGRAPAWT